MAADSDGCASITTIVTCEGDLSDPGFVKRFNAVVSDLNSLLGQAIKVHKLEPWNSVRVTLSIPREAALRLRKLASEGSQQLRALGILSVQVEGDQVISLRIANSVNSEPQEVILQTVQDGAASTSSEGALSKLLSATTGGEKVQFKSPNVVCPADSVVPKVPVVSSPGSSATPPAKTFAGPFPFTSMNQAIHAVPPPPYPGKVVNPAVTISSPLLVNLLQNDGAQKSGASVNNKNEPIATGRTVTFVSQNGNLVSRNNNRIVPHLVSNTADSEGNKSVPASKNSPVSQATTTTTTMTTTTSPTSALLLNTSNNNTNNSKLNSTILTPSASEPPGYPSASKPLGEPKSLPPPPPYTVAVNQQWDQAVQSSPFLDLTPSLTDLKADDLDELLPTLERDLARSPPEIPEELTRAEDKRKFLINPLTGELEPQSSGESEVEELGDVFTGLPSPAAISDEDTNSTIRPDTTDQSDSETVSHSSDGGKHSRIKSKVRDRGRDSPGLKPTEKIKLRLKLEKNEPINSAYKVDVSFIQQQPKKAATSSVVSPSEELRVPPLHISLRGRNHAFITNKKKNKSNPDGSPGKVKVRKAQQKHMMMSEAVSCSSQIISASAPNCPGGSLMPTGSTAVYGAITNITEEISNILNNDSGDPAKINNAKTLTSGASSITSGAPLGDVATSKKVKKFKSNHELLQQDSLNLLLNNTQTQYSKDKQKERRGSDSELAKSSLKFLDGGNRVIFSEKKRRLSQSEIKSDDCPPILGSTNIGTIAGLPQKSRKDKNKVKDGFKINKEVTVRSKGFSNKQVSEKFTKQVALPTGDVDMEAKFKQRLLEEEKGVPRPPHRTEVAVMMAAAEIEKQEKGEEAMKPESEPPPLTHPKSPEPDKCNTPDRKPLAPDPGEKQPPNRSPNSGAQGEDSGIESMDALSEKSPNQASQSPHADIPDPIQKSKTQVPDMLDIEAQLAKMEGLNGVEDLNENRNELQPKLAQCCELTSALQDSLKQGAVSLSSVSANTSPGLAKEQIHEADVTLVPLKAKTKEDDLEPLPVRVTPPLYTYSNPEKTRSDSPTLSDEDSGNCIHKTKSLLEQLLIEIPQDTSVPSSPSPATRSVRTRALTKLNSPELSSPVPKTRSATPNGPKRKRHESDSSGNSVEDVAAAAARKKSRKSSENASELIKACIGADPKQAQAQPQQQQQQKKAPPAPPTPVQGAQKQQQDESSDSDEPLIEKVRKTNANSINKGKVKKDGVKTPINTRRSVRATANPSPNTRSKGEKNAESEALRRKTRSTVSEGENKRKKEVK